MAKIPQTTLIFHNPNGLKDTRHYIAQQLPASRSDQRQFKLPESNALKCGACKKAVLTHDKLFVTNKHQTLYMKPHLPQGPLANQPLCQITESSVFTGILFLCTSCTTNPTWARLRISFIATG